MFRSMMAGFMTTIMGGGFIMIGSNMGDVILNSTVDLTHTATTQMVRTISNGMVATGLALSACGVIIILAVVFNAISGSVYQSSSPTKTDSQKATTAAPETPNPKNTDTIVKHDIRPENIKTGNR